MKYSRAWTLGLCLVFTAPVVSAFSFSPENGITGGSGSDGSGIPGSGAGIYSEVVWECNNSADDDADSRSDLGALSNGGDSGCVQPVILDRNEGNTWDTDLTSTYLRIDESGVSVDPLEDPTLFFAGELKYTGREDDPPDTQDENVEADTGGEFALREQYIKDAKNEQEKYAKGIPGTGGDSQNGAKLQVTGGAGPREFPTGTVLKDTGRIIDAPTDADGVARAGRSRTCGDGKLNDDESTKPSDVAISSADNGDTGCRDDYGALKSKKHVRPTPSRDNEGVYNPDNEDELNCENDDIETSSASCGETLNPGCFNPEPRNSLDNLWYDTVNGGQSVKSVDCVDAGTAHTYDAGDKETDDDGDTSCTSDIRRVCQARNRQTSTQNCNSFNRVDGGGEGQYRGKPDNDAAASFTDYKAYGSNSEEKAWCQFERVLTVDADGPNGNGDGFVLINASSGMVMGSESPDGSDSVGQNIYFRKSTTETDGALQRSSVSKRDFSKTCPGDKTYCIKYVDYLTERDAVGWGSRGENVQATNSQIKEAVRSRVARTMTADESYSVCKKINSMSGPGEIVDCDYEVDGEDVSPLPEACGDQPKETLVAFEGPQVNPRTNDFLAYNQRCMDYSSDGDTGIYGGEVSVNYCLYKGQFFPQGSMIDISSSYSGAEVDGGSPDLEVCANAPQTRTFRTVDNAPSGRDYGGEWYDLDNDQLKELLADSPGVPLLPLFERTNPNPHHPEFNPTGGETGFALEDDCGNQRFGTRLGCEDTDETSSRYYTFFSKKVELSPP